MPKGSSKEQVLWKIVQALEQLVGEQLEIGKEMARRWESSERMKISFRTWLTRPRLPQTQWSYLHGVNIS